MQARARGNLAQAVAEDPRTRDLRSVSRKHKISSQKSGILRMPAWTDCKDAALRKERMDGGAFLRMRRGSRVPRTADDISSLRVADFRRHTNAPGAAPGGGVPASDPRSSDHSGRGGPSPKLLSIAGTGKGSPQARQEGCRAGLSE